MTALMPRRLGLPARAQISNDDPKASVPQRERYEWLESRLREFKHLEPVNAQTVLEQRLPEQGVTVIVGEPGAGKSVLAATWRDYFETQKRTCILLEGGSLEANLRDDQNILLKMAEHPRVRVNKATKAELGKDSFPDRAVLMVDALDELPSTLDERLAAKIFEIAQHHPVILTCRTAVWANRVKEKFVKILGQTPQTYSLLGFTPDEQREFLNEWAKQHGIAAERAASIAAELQARPQLSYLAANPLMLDLIAQVTLELNKPVPDSRAELYGSAILELLNRSHQDGDLESWGTKYEPFMRALAMASVQANPNQDSQLETELDWDTVEQALETASVPEAQHIPFLERLQRSGLVVRVGDKAIPKRRFIHLTLQEYALASAWLFGLRTPKTVQASDLSARLQNKLLEHWWQPNFESTLSLALSIASKHGANLHDPIMEMLASWERGKPSALRTALHLVNAANVTDQKVIDMLLEVLHGFELGLVMASSDHESPPDVLAALASNEDWSIRMMVAINLNAPANTLHKLVKDAHNLVLVGVGENRNTSPYDLEILVRHKSRGVRWSVASNPNLPTSGKQYLMEEVREEVKLRPQPNDLPKENQKVIRARLTKEQNDRAGRRSAAQDKDTPSELLTELFNDTDGFIRQGVARNPNTPISVLEKFVNDKDREVRGGIAANPSTPHEILEQLADDEHQAVRNQVAENLNYIPETHPTYPRLTRPSTERTVESKTNPRVFISYTHDSPEHVQRILEFSNTLRSKGIEAKLDQYEPSPARGWPSWMSNELELADFIVIVFTEKYKKRFDGNEEPGVGLGGTWESMNIKTRLYNAQGWHQKFLPVVIDKSDLKFIPIELQPPTHYIWPRDLEKLVQYIYGHNPNPAPPLGSPPVFVTQSSSAKIPSIAAIEVPQPSIVVGNLRQDFTEIASEFSRVWKPSISTSKAKDAIRKVNKSLEAIDRAQLSNHLSEDLIRQINSWQENAGIVTTGLGDMRHLSSARQELENLFQKIRSQLETK